MLELTTVVLIALAVAAVIAVAIAVWFFVAPPRFNDPQWSRFYPRTAGADVALPPAAPNVYELYVPNDVAAPPITSSEKDVKSVARFYIPLAQLMNSSFAVPAVGITGFRLEMNAGAPAPTVDRNIVVFRPVALGAGRTSNFNYSGTPLGAAGAALGGYRRAFNLLDKPITEMTATPGDADVPTTITTVTPTTTAADVEGAVWFFACNPTAAAPASVVPFATVAARIAK